MDYLYYHDVFQFQCTLYIYIKDVYSICLCKWFTAACLNTLQCWISLCAFNCKWWQLTRYFTFRLHPCEPMWRVKKCVWSFWNKLRLHNICIVLMFVPSARGDNWVCKQVHLLQQCCTSRDTMDKTTSPDKARN